MTVGAGDTAILATLDSPTAELVRLAAVVAVGNEQRVRAAIARAHETVPPEWIEELILQTYLFAGFPRALNAMREWRRVSGRVGPADDHPSSDELAVTAEWRRAGEATCATVYGEMYERLRRNIRALHPVLDEWMIVEGYGKVLSRPGLDLARRELCIVAACAAAEQDRQLHSHFHGALNAGVTPTMMDSALDAIAFELPAERMQPVRLLWQRVRGK
jgi:4-carboxymuconolactone decarboxylase